ncbi:MAG: elongation factor Ts [Spirochaetales bacterium]|nr:elongation factor Ts [Spirochaetales bacterium]
MGIKAVDVKKLRDMTGAGMLDCKKALVETNGDFQLAEKKLKELGLAAVAKRSGRATNNGRVFSRVTPSKAAILELACETDFVARNKDFISLGESILNTIFQNNLTEITSGLKDLVTELISTIKENMTLKRFSVLNIAENEIAAEYIHGEGSIGVLVKLRSDDPMILQNNKVKEFLFDCALHIAAFNPLYLSKENVDDEYLAEQKDIFTKQGAALGKPANIVENIVKGKINKHFSEICFLQQGFVKDDKSSVETILKSLSKELGANLEILDYKYFKVGSEE